MSWKDNFEQKILYRGLEYYKRGKVKGYVQTKDSCMARILGTRIYNTKVWGISSGNMMFSCTCEYAKDGSCCKHEAALLFQWENNNDKGEIIERVNSEDSTDTYFNVQSILNNYEIRTGTMKEATDIISEKLMKIVGVRQYYSKERNEDNLVICFEGQYTGDKDYFKSVRISFTKNTVVSATCGADHRDKRSYYGYFGGYYNNLCAHEVALLLLADEYIKKYNPGDETDSQGNDILEGFKELVSIKNIGNDSAKRKTIRLEPRLSYDPYDEGAKFKLSFRIGQGKLFVVKSLSELVRTKERFGSLKLGKNTIISFMSDTFDSESEKYYRIIEKAKNQIDDTNEKLRQFNYSYGKNYLVLSDSIELSAELLDDFYEAAEGSIIEFKDIYGVLKNKRPGQIKIGEGNLHLKINIRDIYNERGTFSGLKITGNVPESIRGKNNRYIINDEKGSIEKISEVSPIVKLLLQNSRNRQINFVIGKKKLSEFYYRFLPELIDCKEVDIIEENPDRIQRYLPPRAEVIYYLDAGEEDISAKIIAKYGEEEIVLHPYRNSESVISDYRDISYEETAIGTVSKYFPDYSQMDESFICEKTGEKVFDILNDGLREFMAIGEVRASKDFEALRIRKAPQIKVGLSVESGILNLQISTDDMSEEELLELLESYRKKKKFYRLKNGEFIRLENDETIEELTVTMEAMGVTAKEFTEGKLHMPLYRAVYINKLLEEHDEIAADRDKNFKSLIRNFNSVKDSDIEVPKSLEKVLRGYQKYGYKWLYMLSELNFGGILADDMGLGKTLQIISLILGKKNDDSTDKKTSLIVCPASLVYNWEEEIKRFAPEIKVKTITGNQSERKELLKNSGDEDILITSYDLLKRDIGDYEGLDFEFQIIDEAQYIKNPQAAVSKAVKIIKSRNRFALTGTPIENRLSELWSIFDFLMPGFLYTYEKFKDSFEIPVTKNKDEEATDRLKNMVRPFILRRLKENVLKDLPEKIEEVRYARFDKEQRQLYDAQITHMKKLIESQEYSSGKDRIKVLAELTRIRQICCDPELITAGYKGESAKRQAVMELIESAIDGGHRMLVFSQFTSMLELLEKELEERKIEYYKITGATSKEDRIKLVHAFNENDTPVFLISLKAGGTGLNLIGADVVIHYDPWWNIAAQNQATDRAHRIGQTKKVSVFKLIVKDTIEEKILKMQDAKKDLADAILSGEAGSLTSLSKEELMELLG